MTRIDFYILDEQGANADALFVCKLTEKAYQQGHRIYLHVGDAARAQQLDQMLWTFRAGSFVPHATLPDGSSETPVHIGHGDEPGDHHDVLVNLSDEVPLFFSRFERVAEVITGDEQQRAKGRERFRFYRERGYELQTHNIGSG